MKLCYQKFRISLIISFSSVHSYGFLDISFSRYFRFFALQNPGEKPGIPWDGAG